MGACQGLLEAVTVQVDGAGLLGKGVGGNPPGIGLAGQELVDQQAVGGLSAGLDLEVAGGQVNGLIAESQKGGGLDAQERLLCRQQAPQDAGVGIDDLAGLPDQPLGEPGAPAFAQRGQGHAVAEGLQQLDGLLADGDVVVVGKLVGVEPNFADAPGGRGGLALAEPRPEGFRRQQRDGAVGVKADETVE